MREYREIYFKNLSASVIPFWYNNSPDWEHGGSFSCLDLRGNVYDSKKYVWLVARSAWMFARLFNVFDRDPDYLKMAELGIDYLWKYARDDQGRYYFSLTRKGEPWFFQRKPYGAVFAMMAYLEYFKASGKAEYKKEAIDLFRKIHQWIQDPARLGRPSMQGVPAMSNLADVMVLASMALELAAVENDPQYQEIMVSALKQCRRHFNPELKILMENVPDDPDQNIVQWPEGRLFNPGHSIEVAWFVIHLLEYVEDSDMFSLALDALEGSLNFSWDQQYGGIYYFMDVEGKPTLQLESGMKLWWPHTEAIYALVLAFCRTEDARWLEWLDKVHDYAFSHFVDNENGAWFGYCDRYGTLTHTSKGSHYKGFFHVPRALLFSILEIDRYLSIDGGTIA
ncbi:MAG: N-acylglucosamine 2-epimerase [Bacteroides sp. SM23_62]|nr:MAG: N-acylglucosamine 2-epimerase [Bacteroides sp. SM23_62]